MYDKISLKEQKKYLKIRFQIRMTTQVANTLESQREIKINKKKAF